MTKAQSRALLDTGTRHVARWTTCSTARAATLAGKGAAPTAAMPGYGRWLGRRRPSGRAERRHARAGTTVGAALPIRPGTGSAGSHDDAVLTRSSRPARRWACWLEPAQDVEWNALDPSGTPRSTSRSRGTTSPAALVDQGRRERPRTRRQVGRRLGAQEADPANPAASFTFSLLEVGAGSSAAAVRRREPGQPRDRPRRRRVVRHRRQLRRERSRGSALRAGLLARGSALSPSAGPSRRGRSVRLRGDRAVLHVGQATLFFSVQHPGLSASAPGRRAAEDLGLRIGAWPRFFVKAAIHRPRSPRRGGPADFLPLRT